MPRGKSKQDKSILEMALVGYEIEKKRIDDRIREIRTQLGAGRAAAKVSTPTNDQPSNRRKLSAAARKRIAAAQRKRWAEHRKALAQSSKA